MRRLYVVLGSLQQFDYPRMAKQQYIPGTWDKTQDKLDGMSYYGSCRAN